MKKELSKYDINIHGLEDKNHEYTFEGGDSFFDNLEQDIIQGGSFDAKVILEKNATFIRLTMQIDSRLKLECDRTLEVFEEDFSSEEKYIYKYGSVSQEMDDDIEIIPHGTPKINIANLLADYILLQVPMKKLHPKFRNEESEDGTMVYVDPGFAEEKEDEEKTQDPRWAALINLKNNK